MAGTEVDEEERSGTLAESVIYRGVELPKGTRFGTDIDFGDFWARLGACTRVHGHTVTPQTELKFRPFPPPLVEAVSLPFVPLYPVIFARALGDVAAGRLWMTPSEDVCLEQYTVKAGDRVRLSRLQALEMWLLCSPRDVAGLALESGLIDFGPGGRVRKVMLYASQMLQGYPCSGSGLVGTEVVFHETGAIKRLVLSKEHHIGGKTYQRGTRLTLAHDGMVVGSKRIWKEP